MVFPEGQRELNDCGTYVQRKPYRSDLSYQPDQPINFTLQFIPDMLLEAETKLRLRHFISTFLISGARCLGPQCNFTCGGFEDACEIIPSKCVVDVLELKYGTKNPYAPTLVDFLSSHQRLFGTGSSSVLAYVCFLLAELLLTDVSPESIAYSAFIVEAVFVDICQSLRGNFECSSQDRSFVDDQKSASTYDASFTECYVDHGCSEVPISNHATINDIDWFFDNDDLLDEIITSPPEKYQEYSITQLPLDPLINDCIVSTGAESRVGAARSAFSEPAHSDLWLALGLQHCFAWEFELDNLKSIEKQLSRGSTSPSGSFHLSQDIPDNGSGGTLQSETDYLREKGVALPMRLAMQAAKSLWINELSMRQPKEITEGVHDAADDRLQVPEKSNSYKKQSDNRKELSNDMKSSTFLITESARIFAVDHKGGEEEEYDYYSFSSELSLDDLVIHTIAGVPSSYCNVYPGSLLSSCKKEAVIKNFERKSSGEGMSRVNVMSGTSIVFHRVAVVDTGWGTDAFDSGVMGEGAGASIEAHKLNYLHLKSKIISPTSTCKDASSDRISSSARDHGMCVDDVGKDGNDIMTPQEAANETSDSVYLVNSVSHMQQIGVSALCCSDAFCSQKLLDAFNSKGIAVFPLSARHLQTVAQLAGAEIAGDILDLQSECIGGPLCISVHPFLSMRASDSVNKVRSKDFINKGGTFVTRQREDDEVLIEFSRYQEYGKSYPDVHLNTDTCATVAVTSIIIASPTEAQTATIKDRFLRCLHRLRGVVQGAGVMPGAGLPEVLMCLQLEKEIESRTLQLSDMLEGTSTFDSSKERFSKNHSEDPLIKSLDDEWREMKNGAGLGIDSLRGVINALQAVRRGLHAMIQDVSLSNGSSWADAATAIMTSEKKIKSMLPEAFVIPSPSNGMQGWTLFEPISVQASLRLRSGAEIAALCFVAPIIIATDCTVNLASMPTPEGTSNNAGSQGSSVSIDSPASPKSITPVLDVVGIKVSSFKNALSAIKLFLSARITVTNA